METIGDEGETVMMVKSGIPPQKWTRKELDELRAEDADAELPQVQRLALMVLTYPKGWPHTWSAEGAEHDCCIGTGVEKAWRSTLGCVDRWLSGFESPIKDPTLRILIETVAIDKGLSVALYILHGLLRHTTQKIGVIIFFVWGKVYAFDKQRRTVAHYQGEEEAVLAIQDFSRSVRGCVIDVSPKSRSELLYHVPECWGIVAVRPPGFVLEVNKQYAETRIKVGKFTKREWRAASSWVLHHGLPEKELHHRSKIEQHLKERGLLPRISLEEARRPESCTELLPEVLSGGAQVLVPAGRAAGGKQVGDASKKSVKDSWMRGGHSDGCRQEILSSTRMNKVSAQAVPQLLPRLASAPKPIPGEFPDSKTLEKKLYLAFMNYDFMRRAVAMLKPIKPHGNRTERQSVLQAENFSYPSDGREELPNTAPTSQRSVRYRCLYYPLSPNFPLVDAFFFARVGSKRTIVCLQVTSAKAHHTKPSTVAQFTEYMKSYFNGWKLYSSALSWEIIYVQYGCAKVITTWQKCITGGENSPKKHQKVIGFWNNNIYQYQLSVSPDMLSTVLHAPEMRDTAGRCKKKAQ
ncbi:retrotransposon hot spot (RHS) protein [Trypanosoma grayi]|uniref:retrotransposon hot spot (RHS) protein n=1 Tax=Trypanosoma grayi TaxID=71804 RepID=UPI0004F4542F|nr:retrotransposon hot spot (RHS) protein [Trypanosoma grayi]KEG08745.1 retrotransposon hot spot (RHS) protein [Trypanosoma grayi]